MTDSSITTEYLEAGGRRLRVSTCGSREAPAVLWLHGSGPGVSALSNWEHLLPRFASSYFNVAPDILGFGESEHADPAPVGMVDYTRARAESVIALLDHLGIERAHVVGNSMGGMIALTVALEAPERVDRLVLMGSGGAPVPPTPDLISMVTFYDDPSVDAMAALLPRFVSDPALFAGRLHEIAADRFARACLPEVRRSHLATFDPAGTPVRFSPEQLSTLQHQVLVLHGREDRMLPVACGYYLAEHLPNAQLHVLPHAGHWIQLEQPDRFIDQCALFLAEERQR